MTFTGEKKSWLWSELCFSGWKTALTSMWRQLWQVLISMRAGSVCISFLYNCTCIKPVKSSCYNSCEEIWRYLDCSALEGGESGWTKQKQFGTVEITSLWIATCFFYASRTSGSLCCCVEDPFSFLFFLSCMHFLLKMKKNHPSLLQWL